MEDIIMKKWAVMFYVLALILSHAMCAVIAYNYRAMLCAIEHAGASAPAGIVFLSAIPFCAGILVCLLLGRFFRKRI